MTSFIISSHKERKVSPKWKSDPPFCAFCRIIRENAPAYKVYEDERIMVILDILPIRRGHVLVVPKTHVERLSDLPPEFARAAGEAVSKVANALTKALDNTALNVVCNQEYAQAVPHVHYHIVPAPTTITTTTTTDSDSALPASNPPSKLDIHRREFLAREGLDDDEAEIVLQKIRSKL